MLPPRRIAEAHVRKGLGYLALVASAADEVIIFLEHVNIIHEILPVWATNQTVVIPVFLAGLVFALLPEKSGSEIAPSSLPPLVIHNTLNQTASPAMHGPASPPTPSAAPPAVSPQPNVRCIGAKNIWASQTVGDVRFYEASPGQYRFSVVCFRNEALLNRAISEPFVRAHIVYRDAKGAEITDVARGVWLDEYSDVIQLGLGERKCVIILARGERNILNKALMERQSTQWGENFLPRFEQVFDTPATIEVQLIWGDPGSLLAAVMVDVGEAKDSGLPEVKLRP